VEESLIFKPNSGDVYLSTRRAAELAGVVSRTITNWIKHEKLKHAYCTPGGHYRVSKTEILEKCTGARVAAIGKSSSTQAFRGGKDGHAESV
jgi:excisionase family DNA binding protein